MIIRVLIRERQEGQGQKRPYDDRSIVWSDVGS